MISKVDYDYQIDNQNEGNIMENDERNIQNRCIKCLASKDKNLRSLSHNLYFVIEGIVLCEEHYKEAIKIVKKEWNIRGSKK